MSITKEELAKHQSRKNIWLSIDNKVYDVTKFLETHPGGEEILMEYAGKDATQAFHDIGHSDGAKEEMKRYFKGNLIN